MASLHDAYSCREKYFSAGRLNSALADGAAAAAAVVVVGAAAVQWKAKVRLTNSVDCPRDTSDKKNVYDIFLIDD